MRPVTIDPARGFDNTVDPRVGPQGAITRVENMRVDKAGRLVLRNGYTSLGVTVQGNTTFGSGTLIPHDLHTLGDDLVALGRISATEQTGIRGALKYNPSPRGIWRPEVRQDALLPFSDYMGIAPADSVRVLLSELTASQTDELWCDVAVDSTGAFVALASSQENLFIQGGRVTVADATTGKVVFHQSTSSVTNPLARNLRILAIGTVFYLFEQVTTNIQVRTWDSASSAQFFGAATTIATGVSAIPARYDVAPFFGATDYLIAFPTGTGYTWRRYNTAHVQQTTTSVVSLADAPVGICGATGETVSVCNIRAATGVELRTFSTAGALTVGPTDVSTVAQVHDWCSVSRMNSTTVQVAMHYLFTGDDFCAIRSASTAAHALQTMPRHDNCKFVSKVCDADTEPFIWETLGASAARPFGLTAITRSTATSSVVLAAIALDGAAPPEYAAATAPQKSAFVRGTGTNYYVGVVSKDPRDKTYRANVVACKIFSGDRRQSVESGGSLYIAGGCTTQYDKRTMSEVGFETVPNINAANQNGVGGLLTLLGAYTWNIVYRYVAANGEVTQSSPSAPVSVTMTGANRRVILDCSTSYSIRTTGNQTDQGAQTFVDVYRTEAGGTIPRLVVSELVSGVQYGAYQSVSDGVADSVQQTGNVLYTQGADGSISGRLPLGMAAPCQFITESDGKLIVAGLERDTTAQLSIENRPGEAVGFVNDDLFYIQNPETITGVVAGEDGRRYIFSARNIRELVGPGPNAAGVGDISEPVEIEPRVGCIDWRSIATTEHGVFFQSSDSVNPKIYLLPRGASSAIDVSQGVTDTLIAFPIITSATRHDEEELLTFTLQNAAGTDGRILHLDLRTSGMGKNGWTGRWIIDRVAALEGGQFPEIIGEQVDAFQNIIGAAPTVTIPFIGGARIGDRHVFMSGSQGALAAGSAGTSSPLLSNRGFIVGTTGTLQVHERIYTTASQLANTSVTWTLATTDAVGNSIVFKQWLIRGAHVSQAIELTSVSLVAGTSWALPTLTPTWGSAKNLWIAGAMSDQAFVDVGNPVIRTYPVGYGSASRFAHCPANSAAQSADLAFCSRQFEGTAQSGLTFASPFSGNGTGILFAIRPLAATGTPIKAATTFRDRLVVCNATDVITADPAAIGDLGSTVIRGEWESADIYPMGTAGAGRHLMVSIIGELIGFCQLTAMLSYDGGVSWTGLRQFQLTPTFGYALGQVLKLQWVPKRRKVESVRILLVMADEAGSATIGPTRAFALNQVVMWFEDLAGPARLPSSNTAGIGRRR